MSDANTSRILVIDPDPFTCRGLKELLSAAGYLADTAANGKVALDWLRCNRADLVITEMLMPEMDGIELIQALHRQHPAAKILAISGGGMIPPANYLRLARALRVDQVLAKPFTRTELLEAVKQIFSREENTHPTAIDLNL
jgi:YesN/AraC family two-component response regulator